MKINLASRIILEEKAKFIIAVAGVAFSTFLIIILFGIYFGIRKQVTTYIYSTDATFWIMQEGVQDLFSYSILPYNLKSQIRKKIDGGEVYPILVRNADLKLRKNKRLFTKKLLEKYGDKEPVKRSNVRVVGFRREGLGGPWRIIKGKSVLVPGEVIVDRLIAKNNNLFVGNEIEIKNERFTVVGISAESNLLVDQIVFMRYEDAERIFDSKGFVSHFLVRLKKPVVLYEVQKRLQDELPKVFVLTSQEIADNNKKMVAENFSPIFFTIAAVGFLVGVVVVSLMMYTTTLEKTRTYAILKAIGARKRVLYAVVFQQSLIISILGFLSGLLLIFIFTPIIQDFISLVIVVRTDIVVMTVSIIVLMSILSTYFPIKKIIDIDPLIVFKQ